MTLKQGATPKNKTSAVNRRRPRPLPRSRVAATQAASWHRGAITNNGALKLLGKRNLTRAVACIERHFTMGLEAGDV